MSGRSVRPRRVLRLTYRSGTRGWLSVLKTSGGLKMPAPAPLTSGASRGSPRAPVSIRSTGRLPRCQRQEVGLTGGGPYDRVMPMDAALLVERDREFDAIAELLAAARAGTGRAVLIEGPAGVGKSSLLAAARDEGHDLRVLSARASELEREFPLGVARQLLEPVLAGASDDERAALLSGAGALGAGVLGQPSGDAAETPAALHGLYWVTANVASLRPLLLLVDDLQWADLTSARWLTYLSARLEGVPLALV